MRSEVLQAKAVFFDGETATSHQVEVTGNGEGLTITGSTIGPARHWRYSELRTTEPPRSGEPLRLRHQHSPGERLVVSDSTTFDHVNARAPHLRSGSQPRQMVRLGISIAAGITAVVGAGYMLITIAPAAVAKIMPEPWRERLGAQTERVFLGEYARCRSTAGTAALEAMARRLYDNPIDEAPRFSVAVYRMPVVNAFTLPGGRVAISAKLIEAASGAEEVAGVLAHELGHVVNRHPEVALVRVTGLQLLMSLATGSDGGTVLSNLAGITTLLHYSRAAEEAADAYALQLMENSKIDPMGLKRFFERISGRKGAGSQGSSGFARLLDIFSTHPGTRERIAKIRPLAEGPAQKVLAEGQWRALKAICQ
jgi:Zn-dependent protease with chaperone function